MSATLHLRVATPTEIVVDAEAAHVRAEDPTGSFGILPRHAGFLTVLAPSVLSWREPAGREHFIAVRGGVLTVTEGGAVEVVTREALAGDDLARLQRDVLERLRAEEEEERRERQQATRLHLAFLRQIGRYLHGNGDHRPLPSGAPPAQPFQGER